MSSPFNFRHIAAYCTLPRRTRIWHLVLVCGFFLVLVCGTQVLRWSGGGDPAPVEPYMSLADERMEVLFVGTSHFGYGIDPRLYSPNGMNITAGALNYECMEIILGKHLDQSMNLRVLVIEAGIVPLRVDTMTRLEEDYRSLYRIGLDTFDLPLGLYRRSMQWLKESWLFYPVYFMDRWSPSLLVWGSRPLGGEGEGRMDTRGFTPLERVISNQNDGRAVVEHHRLDHLRLDHSAVNLPALLRIVQMAADRHVPVVFIRMPHHASYVENRPAAWETQYQEMLATVRGVVRPEQWIYLDWEQRDEFLESHFADGDHLNVDGVRLLRDLLDPVLNDVTKRQMRHDSPVIGAD